MSAVVNRQATGIARGLDRLLGANRAPAERRAAPEQPRRTCTVHMQRVQDELRFCAEDMCQWEEAVRAQRQR